MFKELQPIVARGHVVMNLIAEGDMIRVTIAQKEPKGAALPINLSILASPEELDADLPGAIARATGALGKPAPVAAQVQSQVENTTAAAARKGEKKAERKAAATTPRKPAKAKPRPMSKAKPRKPERQAPKKAKPKVTAKPPKPAATSAGRATAEECLTEFKELYAKHGNSLNRETFLKHAKTARSFERRFGGWKQFVAAAGFNATSSADKTDPPTVDDRTLSLDLSAPTVDPEKEKAANLVEKRLGNTLPQQWPFPTTPIDIQHGEDKDDTRHGWDVYDQSGAYLSSITTRPKIGEQIGLVTFRRPLTITGIDGRRVIVDTTESAPPQDGTDASGSRADDASPAADADTPSTTAQASSPQEATIDPPETSADDGHSHVDQDDPADARISAKPEGGDATRVVTPDAVVSRIVRTSRGKAILTMTDEVEIGDVMLIPDYGRARVIEYTDDEIIVEAVVKRQPADGVTI